MSYSQNGSSSYMNGSYGREASNGYSGDRHDESPGATGRVRRAGGYGGFLSDNLDTSGDNIEPLQLRQRGFDGTSNGATARQSPERGAGGYNGRRKSRERDGASLSSARTYGNGPGGRQIEGQLQNFIYVAPQ